MPKNIYIKSVKTNSKNVIDFQKYLSKYGENYYHISSKKQLLLEKLIVWNDIWVARKNGDMWCSLCHDKGIVVNSRGTKTNCPRCNYKKNMMSLQTSTIKELGRWYNSGIVEDLETRLSARNMVVIRGEDISLLLEFTNNTKLIKKIDTKKTYCLYYDVLPSEKYKTKISNYYNGDYDVDIEIKEGTYFPTPCTELIIFEMIFEKGES